MNRYACRKDELPPDDLPEDMRGPKIPGYPEGKNPIEAAEMDGISAGIRSLMT